VERHGTATGSRDPKPQNRNEFDAFLDGRAEQEIAGEALFS
jgi:hypothetical protein